jgi:nucleoside-diphosphate-sugar epimerase
MLKSQGKILITGSNGFIGSCLINKLFTAKSKYQSYIKNNISIPEDQHEFFINFDEIIAFDNLFYKQISLLNHCHRNDFKFVYGDVRNEKLLKKYVDEADIIIPLAALVGAKICEKEKELATKVNYEQIKNIVEWTKDTEKKIICPNTNSFYGSTRGKDYCDENSEVNPISHYGITKYNAEKEIIDNKSGISLRLATVMGVGHSDRIRKDLLVQDFVYKAFTDKYIVLFEKDFKRNYIHVEDVALTIIYMINKYEKYVGEVFNVGLSDANLSKHELALKIKQYIPDFSIQIDEIAQDPDKRDYIVSNKKLEDTGWQAHYSLDDAIQELIKAYSIISHMNDPFVNS